MLSLQLWILQILTNILLQTRHFVREGLLMIGALGGYYVIMALVSYLKERLQFQLEKAVTLRMGTALIKTLNGLEYTYYETPYLYNMIEKISDKPYMLFFEGFLSFAGIIEKIIQLSIVFIYLSVISETGFFINVCLILLIFYFDYRIMIVSDELDNEKIPEERRLKYFLGLFFEKNELMEIRILQKEAFFMDKIKKYMNQVFRKRLKISLHTQKYYGFSCLTMAVWSVWLLITAGENVYLGVVGPGVFLACIKMIDMINGLSGQFSEEYVKLGENLQKVTYLSKFEGMKE